MKTHTATGTAIALVGNPNAGKTTLFNALTGARQRVGNWPGVTVEKIEGTLSEHHREHRVVDLPGIYSLDATSEDERIARSYILGHRDHLFINVVDAANLERNLYLTAQILELGVPMLLVLTMSDLAERHGIEIDAAHLGQHLGVPVIAIDGTRDRDLVRLRHAVIAQLSGPVQANACIRYPEAVESAITAIEPRVGTVAGALEAPARWIATKVLEGDREIGRLLESAHVFEPGEQDRLITALEGRAHEESDILFADARFGFVHGIAEDVMRRRATRESRTERIDRVVMHPLAGIPVFLAVMYSVFWTTIALGGAFIDFFDIVGGLFFVEGPRAALAALGAPSWLTLIIADGIGTGLQTVATFVPIIFAMFFMLAILENSGYMARAAFVTDRVMRKIGLPGKSFVPLMVGFGCTVPAIISTRALESRKDRLMTVFIAPFMSCGARLPVYALFAAAFFPGYPGLVVFSLYLAGIAVAVLTGLLLKHTLFPGDASHLVMELPPYHTPRIIGTVRQTWARMRSFVKNAGVTIATAVAILSVLNAVPYPGGEGDSVLARVGKFATPVFSSIGIESDNWPATVGLVSGLFAKEAIVGTLNSLYSQQAGVLRGAASEADAPADAPADAAVADSGSGDGSAPLRAWLASVPAGVGEALASVWSGVRSPGFGLSGEHGSTTRDLSRLRTYFTPSAAYAYLLFVLLYLPCLAAFGAAWGELGRRYGSLLGVHLLAVAWSLSTLVYQLLEGHSVVLISVALAVLGLLYLLFATAGRHGLELREA